MIRLIVKGSQAAGTSTAETQEEGLVWHAGGIGWGPVYSWSPLSKKERM